MHHRFNLNGEDVDVMLVRGLEGWSYEGHTVQTYPRNQLKLTMADGASCLAHLTKVGDVWWIHIKGRTFAMERIEPGASSQDHGDGLVAPMPGKVLETLVKKGDFVEAGQAMMVLEAMKMEHRIVAAQAGTVVAVHYQSGDQVDQGAVLLEIEDSN